MPLTVTRSQLAGLTLLYFALAGTFGAQNVSSDLTAHEWGTFTSIAGTEGHAIEWVPTSGSGLASSELPSFIEHLRGGAFKPGLRGTVRMETPVLYFYSPQETTVSVKVSFRQGLITEWYPSASQVEPSQVSNAAALYERHVNGSIAWNSVKVSPNLAAHFPRDREGRQYYAARETSSAPLVVHGPAGDQQEKFLFYRGVSSFSVPVSASASPDGELHITNLGQDEIPAVILFERRGDKLGYRLGGALQGEMSLESPDLTASFESLSRDLEDILTGQGLYPDEARAMIETWHDSWFEEGSRLLYVVPNHFTHAILPLTINPTPSQTVRVFVGRLELVSPATLKAVATGLATHDRVTIDRYGRFLSAILDQMRAESPARAAQIDKDLELTYNSGTKGQPQN